MSKPPVDISARKIDVPGQVVDIPCEPIPMPLRHRAAKLVWMAWMAAMEPLKQRLPHGVVRSREDNFGLRCSVGCR